MRYSEAAPPAAMAAHVRCIWHFETGESGEAQGAERIVPDGRCELIVHVGMPYLEGTTPQPRVLFAGQLTRPLWLRPAGAASVVGVRFQPAGARRFLGLALSAATDRRLALTELWPGATRALIAAMRKAKDDEGRAQIAAAFVAGRLADSTVEDDDVAIRCARAIEESNGTVTMDQLALEAGIGRRQLERRFRDAVGVAPHLFASILRFRRVFDALQEDRTTRWTDAAAAAGYFDQSHLIRDCRRFLGCTPTQFLQDRGTLATALLEG